MDSNLSIFCYLFVCLLFQVNTIECVNATPRSKEVLDNILKDYDVRIRPEGLNSTGENSPTIVSVNMFLRFIEKVDDYNMESSMQVTLRQSWTDKRLKYNADNLKYVTLTDPANIWTPDLFFSNEKQASLHNLMRPNTYLRVYPDGNVIYSSRISLTLSCPMNLKAFPFDHQYCDLRLASYGWTTDELVFLWKESSPVQMSKQIYLPHFELVKFFVDYCNSKTTTGEYSCLKVTLSLRREIGFYLRNIFIPSGMLVLLSCLSFWLHHSAIMARSVIGITTLLAMVMFTRDFNATLASVSYTKSIDVYTGVCLNFLFAALLESIVVNYLSRSVVKTQTKRSDDVEETGAMLQHLDKDTEQDQVISGQSGNKAYRRWFIKIANSYEKIDFMSRILFPLAFLLFVVVYWFA